METLSSPFTAELTPKEAFFCGMEWIENKFTQSLEMNKDDLAVYRGWSDLWLSSNIIMSRQRAGLYNGTTQEEIIRETEKLNQWYREKERIVYFLGHRATVVSLAHFTLDRQPYRESSHFFDIEIYNPHLDDLAMCAFLQAIHHDLIIGCNHDGDIWAEVDENNEKKVQLLQAVSYRKEVSIEGKTWMYRRGVGNY